MYCSNEGKAVRRAAPLAVCALTAALTGILAAQAGVADELVVNGGFEDPIVPVEELGKGWTTFYGENATATTCEDNRERECNGGMRIPGWSVDWFDFELDARGDIVATGGGPGRVEVQRDLAGQPALGGISAYEGDQKAELDSHHRYQPPGEPKVSNNVAIYQTLPTCPLTPYELNFAWKARTADKGDSTLLVLVNEAPLLTVGDFREGWQRETYRFISGEDPGQLLGFTSVGEANTLGAFVDGISVQGQNGSVVEDCVRVGVCGEKPAMIELLYDADDNGFDVHDQDADAVIIDTYGPLPSVAQIKVFDHKRKRTELFSGTRSIGQTFQVTGKNIGRRWIPPHLIVEITDPATGQMVQSIEFHTSCSQPLNLGDQFGGIGIYGFRR